MNWMDLVIIVVGISVAFVGWRMGGIQIGVVAIGVFAGIALSSRLHDEVARLFSRFIDSDNGAEVASFIAIFILALLAAAVLGTIAHAILVKVKLGSINKAAGFVLGVLVTFAIGSAVLSTIQSYPVMGLEGTIEDSAMGTFLADNFDVVLRGLRFIPDDLGV